KKSVNIRPAILITLIISNLSYLLEVVAKIPEPQYILPLLAWLVVVAAFGLNRLATSSCSHGRRAAITLVVALHLLVAFVFTCDLKASHVPAFKDIENAAKLIPANSRVIAAYPFYGAGPAIWLNRNTYAVHTPEELEPVLPELQKDGFDYIIILDVKSHSVNPHVGLADLGRMGSTLFHSANGTNAQPPANLIDYTSTNSPFRQFCDHRFTRLYSTRYVVLYSLTPASRL
ncbi:MAG: hypothetical protein ABSE48_22125, partial [Verrucomicrobiota bacterium]